MNVFFEVAEEEKLNPEQTRTFIAYFLLRGFGKSQSYVREWAKRFREGMEYLCSDLEGQALLRRLCPEKYKGGQ